MSKEDGFAVVEHFKRVFAPDYAADRGISDVRVIVVEYHANPSAVFDEIEGFQ